MSKSKFLHCRWCNFKVLKVRRLQGGEKVSGWAKLQSHQDTYHLEAVESLTDQLDEKMGVES